MRLLHLLEERRKGKLSSFFNEKAFQINREVCLVYGRGLVSMTTQGALYWCKMGVPSHLRFVMVNSSMLGRGVLL